ncbi:syntaxin-18 isoform X3 [Acinonyx jubatus]|uniref:Syntaxin-18 isoform X3 n=1 Tax=Acinonyx jubatus TaxID=32536 RepID=A0A6J1XDW5_ACIJB|nr:syntaxin-18 isoform X3 [Acinonyx jubatus]
MKWSESPLIVSFRDSVWKDGSLTPFHTHPQGLHGTGLLTFVDFCPRVTGKPSVAAPVLKARAHMPAKACSPRPGRTGGCSHIMSEYGRMTDTERDQIDQDAQTFMRTCSEAIQQLRTQAHKEIHSQQVKEHRSAVLDFIEDYLKRVCKLYSEQRAIRVKRVVDKKRLSKLEPEPRTKTRASVSSEKVSRSPSQDSEEKSVTEDYPEKVPAESQPELGTWGDGKGEDELSPEEIQMFEQENQRLIGEMNSLFDEVRQIEGRVVEISRLQEIFTEKVLQQEAEIDSIHQLVVGATENIKEGNEDIREAIKNNAGFRVWVLFFLVMCSFSLLFLDWYDS